MIRALLDIKFPRKMFMGRFLKNPVIEYVGEYNNQTNAYIQKEDFYPLLATEYGAYFHYGKKMEIIQSILYPVHIVMEELNSKG